MLETVFIVMIWVKRWRARENLKVRGVFFFRPGRKIPGRVGSRGVGRGVAIYGVFFFEAGIGNCYFVFLQHVDVKLARFGEEVDEGLGIGLRSAVFDEQLRTELLRTIVAAFPRLLLELLFALLLSLFAFFDFFFGGHIARFSAVVAVVETVVDVYCHAFLARVFQSGLGTVGATNAQLLQVVRIGENDAVIFPVSCHRFLGLRVGFLKL